jgi:hypothetical protein
LLLWMMAENLARLHVGPAVLAATRHRNGLNLQIDFSETRFSTSPASCHEDEPAIDGGHARHLQCDFYQNDRFTIALIHDRS